MKKFFIFFFLLFPSPVHAQEINLSLNPPVVELLIAPNKKVTQTFTFKTQGENVSIIPEIHLFKSTDDEGHAIVDPLPLSLATLPLTISSSPPFNKPFASSDSTIPITLTFESASVDLPEDLYLALVLKATDSVDKPLQSTSTYPAISALIAITINPSNTIPIDLEIKDFNPSFFHDSWLPLLIQPTLKNKTSLMIHPEGKYEIISPSGKTIFTLPLYPNLILGNSSRIIQGSNNPAGVAERLDSRALTWKPKWSNFGPHRLRLTITTQGGTKITEIEKIIWILPLRIGIIIVLFLLLFIFFLTSKFNSAKNSFDNIDINK